MLVTQIMLKKDLNSIMMEKEQNLLGEGNGFYYIQKNLEQKKRQF